MCKPDKPKLDECSSFLENMGAFFVVLIIISIVGIAVAGIISFAHHEVDMNIRVETLEYDLHNAQERTYYRDQQIQEINDTLESNKIQNKTDYANNLYVPSNCTSSKLNSGFIISC